MRFISLYNKLANDRRQVSTSDHLQESEIKDTARLTSVIKSLMTRVANIEASANINSKAQPTEFEVNVGTAGAQTIIQHGFACPVRYSVVYWGRQYNANGVPQANPVTGPELVADPSSDANNLILNSYVAGKAVIRVEPSQYEVVK